MTPEQYTAIRELFAALAAARLAHTREAVAVAKAMLAAMERRGRGRGR